jgi:DNA adenine methylase
LQPILKWPGGKSGELGIIRENMPSQIDRYFEPFLGGGAVYLSISPEIPALVNDKSFDLMELYRNVATGNKNFFSLLDKIDENWKVLQKTVEQQEESLLQLYCAYRGNPVQESDMKGQVSEFVERNRDCFDNKFSADLGFKSEKFIRTVESGMTQKIKRMRSLEEKQGELSSKDIIDNIEGALKAAFYTHFRYLYNRADRLKLEKYQRSAIFFFIRENAYASMFRFNSKGEFNIPYGGISYNRKDMQVKIAKMKDSVLKKRLKNTTFENMDFFEFLEKHKPQKGDFIFLDPPYDTEFSSYDQNPFDLRDQERLADYLKRDCKANFMLVIQKTDLILSLYMNKGLTIDHTDKKYMYTVKERNNRDVTHLMITNYKG